ncbi:pilin [Patescibacteria group bacterium]|nr:pilin [Patescibacteria group bacterium]MBU1246637.1 pilin [Patescibacteria group bacterium]MBU1519679.1 pilin [Patescibacteria group bacterium]MBU1730550.1 pilin [Patescibacteria group bacterium]MBU1956127.1 pilin [Patescibacteria group bacterium]
MKNIISLVFGKIKRVVMCENFSFVKKTWLVFYTVLLSLPSIGLADNETIPNPFKNVDTVSELLLALFEIVTEIGAVVLAVMIVYTGYLFVVAQGKDAELTKAKESLRWVLIGGALVLGAWVLAEAIGGTIDNL